MSKKTTKKEVHSLQEDTAEAVDMTGVGIAEKDEGANEAFEKEEREAAKKTAKKAVKGAYIVTGNLKCDNKLFKRGDAFDGKLYADLIHGNNPTLVTAEQWEKRK